MGKITTAALLLVGCLGVEVWAQAPPSQPAAEVPTVKSGAPKTGADEKQSGASRQDGFPLDQFKEFSAIMVGGPVPGTEEPIHIYRSGNLMRMEGMDSKTYHITDLTNQLTHALAKSGCLKYKNPYVRSYPFMMSSPDNKFERMTEGKETVDGHVCQVEEVVVTVPKHPTPIKLKLWEAEDLQGFPIKVETPMHRVIQYKNVVLGPQDPTLFIFPEECQDSEKTIGKSKLSHPPAPKKAPSGKSQ